MIAYFCFYFVYKATKTDASCSSAPSSTSIKRQTTITAALQIGSKQVTDAALARAFYANGIPFSIIENKYFKEAIAAVAKVGPGYKPPGRQAISEALLANEVANVSCKLDMSASRLSRVRLAER